MALWGQNKSQYTPKQRAELEQLHTAEASANSAHIQARSRLRQTQARSEHYGTVSEGDMRRAEQAERETRAALAAAQQTNRRAWRRADAEVDRRN